MRLIRSSPSSSVFFITTMQGVFIYDCTSQHVRFHVQPLAPNKSCPAGPSTTGPSTIISASATTNTPTIAAGAAIGEAIGGPPGAFVGAHHRKLIWCRRECFLCTLDEKLVRRANCCLCTWTGRWQRNKCQLRQCTFDAKCQFDCQRAKLLHHLSAQPGPRLCSCEVSWEWTAGRWAVDWNARPRFVRSIIQFLFP